MCVTLIAHPERSLTYHHKGRSTSDPFPAERLFGRVDLRMHQVPACAIKIKGRDPIDRNTNARNNRGVAVVVGQV
jgi:hypothetical protein